VTDAAQAAQRPPYGLRGWLLLLFGSIWLTWGTTLALFTAERSGALVYDVVTRIAPLGVWGLVWAVLGLVGAACGALRRHDIGFRVLSVIPFGWGAGLIAAFFTAGSPTGVPLGWTFIALGLVVLLTSRMEDAKLLLRRAAS